MEDAFKAVQAAMMGLPYKSKIPFMTTSYIEYLILEDFEYMHYDQDVSHGLYKFKKGELVSLRADTDPMFFLPDRSKMLVNRVYTKGHQF